MTDIVAFLVVLIAVNPLNALQVPSMGLVLARELQQFVDLIPIEELLEISKAYLGPGRTFPNSHEIDEQQRVETMGTIHGTSA